MSTFDSFHQFQLIQSISNCLLSVTCLTSSVLTLSAISCDRTMAIMFPLRSRVTKQRTDAVIGAIWLFSFAIAAPFLIFRRLQILQWSDYTETNCLEVWPSNMMYSSELGTCIQRHNFKRAYYTLVTTTLFFAPVFIMMSAYSAIIWKLWVNKVPGEAHYNNIRQQKKSKRKVIQMVIVVLLVFVICWLPLQLIVLYSIYVHSTDDGVLPEWFPKLSYYSTFIAYSNSAFNPLIYGGFNKNFRNALCNNALCGLWTKQNRPLNRPRKLCF
ncbi:hypothetical protein BLOT_016432 [Blomia tropicalis]|nr:hypothetical protein BLOT_016432 [Blomia tropicalis]